MNANPTKFIDALDAVKQLVAEVELARRLTPPDGFTPQQWWICQTYSFALMNNEGHEVRAAIEKLWPEIIKKFVEYMGWTQKTK